MAEGLNVTPLSFMDSVMGLAAIAAQTDQGSAAEPIRLAVVDPAYVAYTYPTTLPKVTFEGEDTLTTKRYPVVGSYLPQPNDRVVMIPVGHTFVIIGSLSTPPAPITDQATTTAVVTTASTSYVSLTGGPSVSLNLRNGQKARVAVSGQAFSDTVGANGALMSWRTTGASGTSTAADDDGHEIGINDEWTPLYRESLFTATGAGSHTFETRYRVIGTTTGNFKNRRILAQAL
jgi:hypothetical protein